MKLSHDVHAPFHEGPQREDESDLLCKGGVIPLRSVVSCRNI